MTHSRAIMAWPRRGSAVLAYIHYGNLTMQGSYRNLWGSLALGPPSFPHYTLYHYPSYYHYHHYPYEYYFYHG